LSVECWVLGFDVRLKSRLESFVKTNAIRDILLLMSLKRWFIWHNHRQKLFNTCKWICQCRTPSKSHLQKSVM